MHYKMVRYVEFANRVIGENNGEETNGAIKTIKIEIKVRVN
jgi:hypothetical protein